VVRGTRSASVDASTAGISSSEIATPFALIDGPVLRRNIAQMQEAMAAIGAGRVSATGYDPAASGGSRLG
jgi:D-serine deaminase-like pyridoxal phosphate-dependent protein